MMYAEQVEWSWPGALQASSKRAFPTQRVLLLETYIFPKFENHFFSIYVVQKIRMLLSSSIILFSKWDLRVILQEKKGQSPCISMMETSKPQDTREICTMDFSLSLWFSRKNWWTVPPRDCVGAWIVERPSDELLSGLSGNIFHSWFLGQTDILSDEASLWSLRQKLAQGMLLTWNWLEGKRQYGKEEKKLSFKLKVF